MFKDLKENICVRNINWLRISEKNTMVMLELKDRDYEILKFIWGQNIGKRRQPREFFFCGCETSSRRISYLKFASWSKVICCSLVSKLCPTLWDPMDCSPPGSSPWTFPGKNTTVACLFFLYGDLPDPVDQTQVSYVVRQILYHRATSVSH